MYIAIKSELDSRVILYPMIRVLKDYGHILVISSNRQLRRLIEDEDTMGFRDITVIVDETGSSDEIYADYQVEPGDYDYVILDNMGVVDYDVCIVPVGAQQSADFDEEIKLMLEDEGAAKIKIMQFGKPAKGKSSKPAKEKEKRPTKKDEAEEYDPAEKFKYKEKNDRAKTERPIVCKFPTYEEIETVEAIHKFYNVDGNIINALYNILKENVYVDANQFRKGASRKDEYSGYFKSRESDWSE